jgi:hypothetical protein
MVSAIAAVIALTIAEHARRAHGVTFNIHVAAFNAKTSAVVILATACYAPRYSL